MYYYDQWKERGNAPWRFGFVFLLRICDVGVWRRMIRHRHVSSQIATTSLTNGSRCLIEVILHYRYWIPGCAYRNITKIWRLWAIIALQMFFSSLRMAIQIIGCNSRRTICPWLVRWVKFDLKRSHDNRPKLSESRQYYFRFDYLCPSELHR